MHTSTLRETSLPDVRSPGSAVPAERIDVVPEFSGRPFWRSRFWKLLFLTLRMKLKFYLSSDKSYADHIHHFYSQAFNPHVEDEGDKFASIREEMVQLAEPRPGDSVLDVGTGEGWQAAAFARRGLICTGLDYVPDRVKQAEKIHGNGITWLVGDASDLHLDSDSFDIVSVSLFLHDLPLGQELAALRELRRVSRRRVIIVEPQTPSHWFIGWLYMVIGDLFDESICFGDFVRRDFDSHLEAAGLKLVNRQIVFGGLLTIFVCDV